MSQELNYDGVMHRLFDLDENIRFAAVANMNGEILATHSRPNTNLYLSHDDTLETIQHAISAWKSREKALQQSWRGTLHIGCLKLRRATIPLPSGNLLL